MFWIRSSALSAVASFVCAFLVSLVIPSAPALAQVQPPPQPEIEWEKTFGGAGGDGATSVKQTADGGYIVAGLTASFGAGNGDVYLIKLKPDQPPPPKPCSPDVEAYDEMATELSHNIEVFGLGRVCAADLTGTIGVKRYLPYVEPDTGLRTIETKLTKLELTGTDPTCGEIKITLQPGQASGGKVVEQKVGTCFPADSYFDVYIQVQIPGQKLLANCKAATMRCTVSALPPIGCVYQLGAGFDVDLYDATSLDCQSPGNPVGKISAAAHQPTAAPVPPVVIPPPTRIQLNLYNRTTDEWMPVTEQVRKDAFHEWLPTIVIAHGWNIYLLDGLGKGWGNELAKILNIRQPNGLNILVWDWMEEAKGGTKETSKIVRLQYASNHVFDQSKKLARSLQQLFNASGFKQPIHLMGHSLGSFLVTFSALHLQNPSFGGGIYPVANVTLWDPPDIVPNSLANNIPILRSLGTYVDIYSGVFNDRAYFANAWVYAYGSIFQEGLNGHDTFVWYQNHALQSQEPVLYTTLDCSGEPLGQTVGFGASATIAAVSRRLRKDCLPHEFDVSLVGHSEKISCPVTAEFVYAQYCLVSITKPNPIITAKMDNGIGNRNCDCTVPPDLLSLRMWLRRSGGGGNAAAGAGQAELLTATYTLPQTIATEYDYLQFTYRIEAAPSPATLSLALKDGEETVPLWLATSAVELGEGNRPSPLLDVTTYHGKEVNLIFSLTSPEPDAVVEVSNLTLVQGAFHANVAPVANAGTSRAVEATGATTPVVLDASQSSDGNNDPLTFVWTRPSGADKSAGIAAVGETPTVDLALGGYEFTLFVRDPFDGVAEPKTVLVEVEHPFSRGDTNADGNRDITDAITTLTWLFLDTPTRICVDAADTDDSNAVDVSDAISLLGFLFLGSANPAAPFPDAGLDPTPDLLGCDLAQH